MTVLLFLLLVFIELSQSYTNQARFGHSALQINDSIYFYGGDSSVSSSSDANQWISDLSILPVHSPYTLTDPPWKPASGPQDAVGGPFVYSHVAFMGGANNGNMIVIGGVMPQSFNLPTDEEPTGYSYDWDLGRWNSFSLPSGNHLNRQGAACTTIEHGIAYIWGGKRTISSPPTPNGLNNSNTAKTALSSNIYRFDSVYPANSTEISSQGKLSPPLRYAHTQTLLPDHRIVVLGGFDGATGDTIPLGDVWVFNINTSNWDQINAKLDHSNKPASRSSHSQVLMQDGHSILIYGGYDGYHVYNDVAVLDTRTWTWTVKNTNAAVQGRADHTATMVGTNMIVAFGFTGVSTALTVMSDIEVLDTITWSWTSVYTPSFGHNTGNSRGGNPTEIGTDTDRSNNTDVPSSSSITIVAGAVTGGLVVLVLILVAFYMVNIYHQKKRRELGKNRFSDNSSSTDLSSVTIEQDTMNHPSITPKNHYSSCHHEMMKIKFKDPPSATEPFEYTSSSRRPSGQISHPLQICTKYLPARSDTIGTSTTANSSIILVPSPWTPGRSMAVTVVPDASLSTSPASTCVGFSTASDSVDSSIDSMIRRAASTPTHHPMQSIASNVSKPDDRFYPQYSNLRRAATVSEINKNNVIVNTGTQLTKDITPNTISNSVIGPLSSQGLNTMETSAADIVDIIKQQESIISNTNPCHDVNNNSAVSNEESDDTLFDRQEFILQSDEAGKIERDADNERWSLGIIALEQLL